MLAAPGRAATARLAPVKLQNQRSREIRRTEEGLFFENRMPQMRNSACASFFEVARQSHPPLQFYFRFFRGEPRRSTRRSNSGAAQGSQPDRFGSAKIHGAVDRYREVLTQ